MTKVVEILADGMIDDKHKYRIKYDNGEIVWETKDKLKQLMIFKRYELKRLERVYKKTKSPIILPNNIMLSVPNFPVLENVSNNCENTNIDSSQIDYKIDFIDPLYNKTINDFGDSQNKKTASKQPKNNKKITNKTSKN